MKIFELLAEKKIPAPTKSQCKKPNLSNVRLAQCVSRGWRARDSDKCDQTGTQGVKGSCKPVRGRNVKNEKFGGPIKLQKGGND